MENHARRGPRTTSLSTSDEGIVMDYGDEMQRKRRVSDLNFLFFYIFDCHIKWAHTILNQHSVPHKKSRIFMCVNYSRLDNVASFSINRYSNWVDVDD